jgi:DNA-binding beta-propeller fold protein YncE
VLAATSSALVATLAGCVPGHSVADQPLSVWGRRGWNRGRFVRPRAIAVGPGDDLFIADKTGLIQRFRRTGEFLNSWRMPECRIGMPCGLGISLDGNLLVADTHYHRVLTFTPEGQPLPQRTLGGQRGIEPGQFGLLTDVIQDRDGNYYVSEYGDNDRIQKLDPDGGFLCQFGSHGSEPGQFLRPQCLALDDQGLLWVTDACNHRIQVFDVSSDTPRAVHQLGHAGSKPGELRYPYGIALAPTGELYLSEYGNHRLQKWTREGEVLGVWGSVGREPGQLDQPWGIALDSIGELHVLDTLNHRVQRCRF